MSVNLYNSERYCDPTAFDALIQIENEAKNGEHRPLVYICSPYSGNTNANSKKARGYCRFAVKRGCIPLAPHLLFPQFMNDKIAKERNLALFMNIVLLSKCDELWVFGSKISEGMSIEIEKAVCNKQPIRYFTERCREVLR